MDTIFRGDMTTARGRVLAWVDALFVDHAVFRLVWSNLAEVARAGCIAATIRCLDVSRSWRAGTGCAR